MKILSVYWGHHNRGCWKRLSQILDHLANQGHEIWLLVNQEQDITYSPNIHIVLIKFPIQKFHLSEIYFFLISPLTSILINCVFSINILLAFDGHNAGLLSLSRFLFPKTKLILCVRSHFVFNNDWGDDPPLLCLLKKKADIFSHNFCDLTIYNSWDTAQEIEKLYSKPKHLVKVLMNHVEVKEINREIRQQWHQNLGINHDDFVIGYCGQLIPRKNVGFLLSAVAKIPSQLNIKVLIQGRGIMYHSLVKQTHKLGLESRVIFLPWTDSMVEFYSSLDLFILPSKYDTCSNSLLDAIGYHRCVLASNCGGNREIVGHDQRLLFSLSNPQNLADKIVDIIVNSDIYQEHKTAVAIRAKELNFNWNEAIEKLIL